MTRKNVDALAALLVQRAGEQHGIHEAAKGPARDLATWLATRGVLVPSALDPNPLDHSGESECPFCADTMPTAEVPAGRGRLERIARGEPA